MKNYNYYDKLTKDYNDSLSILSGGSSAPVKRKAEHQKEMAVYHNKTSNSGADNSYAVIPSVSRNLSRITERDSKVELYGSAQNDREINQQKSSFEGWNTEKTQPKLSEVEKKIISSSPFGVKPYWQNDNVDKQTGNAYNGNAKWDKPTYDNEFKKNAENQWYNKIAHGSLKEDDWFDSMVKNQEKAENWYKSTYGEKEGKKEYNNLHSRLINTPIDKIKDEEKQFVNYKASDFKVPELQPVKYSYNSNGSIGELSREKTGCYKKGDENLPFLTNYIINGNDGKTGGLNKVWQNASSAEERVRIEKVAEMLRAEETDYDIGKIDSVIILRAIDGAMFAGHTALIIKNSDGHGVYFSFAEVNNEMLGKGEMSVDVLNKQQMDSFFKSGEMNYICNSTGTIESQKYSSYAEIPISKEQGASMIGKGIGYFHNPGRYTLIGKQCDVVVQNILNQGDVDYKSKIFPNKSFSDYRDINELDEKAIKSLGEVVLDKIPSSVRNSIKGWFE